jgi:hypothetical protein
METKIGKVLIGGQEAASPDKPAPAAPPVQIGKVLIGGQEAASPDKSAPAAPPVQIGKVYINGHEAVHKGCGGMAIAFPDVCLCPSPAGPVPVPLTNVVQAKDMVGGALTVLIQGYPAGHSDSYFEKSTGNEVSRNTGGGITSHAVQGAAYFASSSPDVLIEGKYAVRDGDLLTQNHKNRMPANCPPSVWMGAVCPGTRPAGPPKKYTKVLQEGTEWIEIDMVDREGEAIAYENYRAKTPAGETLEGRGLLAGIVTFKGIAKGSCQFSFPNIDTNPMSPGRIPGDMIDRGQAGKRSKADKVYVSGKPLLLPTGKKYRIELSRGPSFWLELTVGESDAETQGCAYLLRSMDGAYQVRRTLADHCSKGHGIVRLEFPDLMADKQYTLTHNLAKEGASRVVFHDVPYARLRERAWDTFVAVPDDDTITDNVAESLRQMHVIEIHRDGTEEDDSLPGVEKPE